MLDPIHIEVLSTILAKSIINCRYFYCYRNEVHSRIFTSIAPGGGGGAHDIFAGGCATLWSLHSFWNFRGKSRTLFGIFVSNGGLQNTILRAVLGKMASTFKTFPKIVDF